MIREKTQANQTEQSFYSWLSRVEEAGHASEDFKLGAAHAFEGRVEWGRSFGYYEGVRAGERWRKWMEAA